MCGIAALFGAGDASLALARRMADSLAHRGPDDEGVLEARSASGGSRGALAHRRLSILDLSSCGHQPMTSHDGRYSLVFNGEIFNFRALRSRLEADGASFVGTSDTEVLLEGWARQGPAFVGQLRGMFAFVLWDRERGVAACVRDPFGIKPLFVAEREGRVALASEVRTLVASGIAPRTLSREAVAGFLATGSVPEPLAAVAGVRALEPGTITEYEVRGNRAERGRTIRFADSFGRSVDASPAPAAGSPAEARAVVRDALRDSVAHHLVSDVPVALFLSGGIDSSAVVALAAEAAAGPLDAFTVVFDEREYDESPAARAVARRFGVRAHEVPLRGDELLASLPSAIEAMDQPSLDGLNTWVVSRAVRRAGIKVVLSGLGGDELFAGYPSFGRARRLAPVWPALRLAAAAAASVAGRRGAGMRAQKAALLLAERDPAAAAYVASRALFGTAATEALLGGAEGSAAVAATGGQAPAGLSLLQRVSWYELTGYMRNTLLRDSDVFSMAHGLELRVPFVDREVAAAALRVPDSMKLERGVAKPALVHALEDLLPREVWDRPKQGFTLPFARWMRAELRAEIDAAFVPRRLARVGLDPTAVQAVWQGFLSGRPGLTWSRPWSLFMLVRWAEQSGVEVADESGPGDADALQSPALGATAASA